MNRVPRALLFGAAICGVGFATAALAAWPDGYVGRVTNMNALRQDMGYPGVNRDNASIKALYDRACELKSSSACNYPMWFGPSGGDLDKAAAFYKDRCPSDPQGCVVVALQATRDSASNFVAEGARKAFAQYELACTKKAYAPGCAGMAELYLAGVGGVAKDYANGLKRADEACKAEDPYGCHLAGTVWEGGLGVKADPAKAIAYYKQGCKGDVPHSCLQMAVMMEAGKGMTKDPKKASEIFKKSCEDENFTAACYHLGRMYEEGRNLDRDYAKAETLYKRSCDVGDLQGCFGLARMYEDGKADGGTADMAVAIYDKACTAGTTDACTRLGKLYLRGKGVAKDAAMGVGFIEKGCSAKDADACDVLGQVFEAGNGVEMNLTKASEFYDASCSSGLGRGCYHMAKLYQLGKGVSQDVPKSGQLFEKACNMGHGQSCGKLATAYLLGDGVPKNLTKAAELLDKACQGEDGESCTKLGGMYIEGKGVTKDPAKGVGYYNDACINENGMGCYYLAKAYEKGEGVPQDFKKSVNAYKDGCKFQYEQACTEGGSVIFSARFQEIVDGAFESRICQVWALDPEKPDDTRLVVDVRGQEFVVMDGPLKGQTINPTAGGMDIEKGKKYKGTTKWSAPGPKGTINFTHFDAWDSEEDPIDAFPGDISRSPDRTGERTLLYHRGEEMVKRNGEPDKCIFPGKAPALTTEHCSDIQALIAAQLVSSCKGE